MSAEERSTGLTLDNGWYVHRGKVVWGLAQHNGWWRAGQRPNIARNAPGLIGPNRTEDLDRLTSAMLRFGYPGFEHNFGLWYDRRRDAHDQAQRIEVFKKIKITIENTTMSLIDDDEIEKSNIKILEAPDHRRVCAQINTFVFFVMRFSSNIRPSSAGNELYEDIFCLFSKFSTIAQK
jgi:hypothetical protein